jgi:hypothetical protein
VIEAPIAELRSRKIESQTARATLIWINGRNGQSEAQAFASLAPCESRHHGGTDTKTVCQAIEISQSRK